MIRALACFLLAFGSASCVSGDYERFDIEVPPDRAVLDSLVVGQSDLAACLEGLGAPLFVRELGTGAALAWGARRDHGWNISASVPISEASANFRYTAERVSLRGVVLFFDASWTLVESKEGWLAELLPEDENTDMARPQDPELLEADG